MIICHCCSVEGTRFFRTQEKQTVSLCGYHYKNKVKRVGNRVEFTDNNMKLIWGASRISKELAIIERVMQE